MTYDRFQFVQYSAVKFELQDRLSNNTCTEKEREERERERKRGGWGRERINLPGMANYYCNEAKPNLRRHGGASRIPDSFYNNIAINMMQQ